MKLKIIKRLKDKYTGEIILPGDILITDELNRIKDLINREIAEVTKKEIILFLDKKDIVYNPKMKKEELIALLGGD
ncbi:MAG: hypothetical protein WC996_03520 [Peptostreptococcales bacterium]